MDLGKIPEIDDYIVVSNIPHSVTEDELTIYFQSKKNGGGDISSLEFIKEAENKTKTAIMKFDDLTDAVNVLQRDHSYKQHLFSLQFVSNKQANLKKSLRCKKTERNSDLQSPGLNEEVTPKIVNRVKKVKKSKINLPDSDAGDTSNEPVNIREIELEDKLTISNEYGQKFAVTNGMSFDCNSIEEIMNSSDVNQIITDNYDSIPIDKKYWNFLINKNSTVLIQLFIEMCLQIDNTSDNVLQLRFKNVSNQQMKDKFETFFTQNASKFFEINESKIQKDNYSETQISNNDIYNTTYDELENDSHIVSNISQNINSKTVFTYYEDIRVTVCQGDITKEVVDIIVNAANTMLDNCCGVSKAILDASQDGSVQINCDKYIIKNRRKGLNVGSIYSSVSGKLNCKNIYHAVIPRWNIYGVQSINILGDLLYNCFLKADKSNMNSIALPLISSGCFGVPKHVAAYCLVTAINTFTSDSVFNLKDIRIVDCDANTISTIFIAFEKFKRECKRSKVKQQPMMLNSDRNNISIGKMGTISKMKDRKSKGEKLNQNSSLLSHQNNPNIKKSKNKEIRKNIREDTPSQKKSNLHRQKYKSEEKNEDHENSVNESESNPQNCSFSSDIFTKSKISQNKENLAFLDNNHNNSKESEREKSILHEKEKKSAIVEKTNGDWLIVTKEDLHDPKNNISVENKGKDTKLDTTKILSNENQSSEFQNFDLSSQNKKTNHEEDNDLIKFVNVENETENALLSLKNNNNGNSSIVLSGNTDVNLEKTMIIKEDMTTIDQSALSDLKNNHYSHISDSQLLVQTLLNNDKRQEVKCEESVEKIFQENCFYPTVSESSLIDHINLESFTEIIDNDKLHDVFTTEAVNVETKDKNGVDSILTNFSNLSINKKEMDTAKPTDVINNKEDHGKIVFIDLTINKEEDKVKHINKNISKEEIENTKPPNLIIINEEENKLKHTDLNINKEEDEVKSADSNIKQEQVDKIKFTSFVNKEETNNLNIYKEEDKINPIDLNLNKKQVDEINPANLIINKELAVIKPTDLNVNKEEVMIKPDLNINNGESMVIPTDLNINNEVVVISTHLNISKEEVMIKPIDVNIVRPSDKSINKEEVVIKPTNLNISTEEVMIKPTHLNINKKEVTINPTANQMPE